MKQYHTVKTKFDVHFLVRRNVIFEREKYNRRRQEVSKTQHSAAHTHRTLRLQNPKGQDDLRPIGWASRLKIIAEATT